MNKLYGAILGDIAGKPFENRFNINKEDIEVYPEDSMITDDSVMTLATAAAIMNDTPYDIEYRYWGNKYFFDYYGKSFKLWLKDSFLENDSFGNGCIMRLSPICHYYDKNAYDSVYESILSCTTSHDHEYSKKCVIVLNDIYKMIREGKDKKEIELWCIDNNLVSMTVVPFTVIDATAQGTLPFVLRIFLDCDSTHSGILKAIEYGGDTDTNASIVGELLATYHKDISDEDIRYVDSHLDDFQQRTLNDFNNK